MSDAMKAAIKKIYAEAHTAGNLAILDDIIAADYVRHQPPMRLVHGLAGLKKFITDVRGAYTGYQIMVQEIIVEGNTSAARIVLSGRHTGQAPTIQAPPTGKQVEMTACVVSHWVNGKIAEEWAYNDYLGLIQQFGVVPPPGLY